eukprot:CAMPEP_0180145512 /NCGR_PEP_ID=MMETSP0986-20121125/17733_1 /TAXON_ID=697907 /ORGANISM="non described non described, Strain CCMP2293" /LENGTH=61 /DNA_ID=CAMNT_0022089941 /DNA_START=50 /DNA_END=235 /DNA_ORIENTATION=-
MGWMRGRGGTVTFVVMGFVTAGVIKWIHQSQVNEKARMRLGVIHDLERVRQKEAGTFKVPK